MLKIIDSFCQLLNTHMVGLSDISNLPDSQYL